MRHYATIPAQVRYFVAVADFNPEEPEGEIDMTDAAVAFENGYPGAIVVEESLTAAYPGFSAGNLLKDLGREFLLVNAEGTHLARYRQVQRVNGVAYEGVGPAIGSDGPFGCFFVKVWSADGQGVYVARTG